VTGNLHQVLINVYYKVDYGFDQFQFNLFWRKY